MGGKIIERFTELTVENSPLNVLFSQWTFDQKLISKALSNVSQIFPHYSLHDESHSNQILVNIERILGEKIKLLSATDLWLLLEAAYCHDLGMVIPMNEIRDNWSSSEFRAFLENTAANSDHELFEICTKFSNKKPEEIFESLHWPLDVFEEVRLVLADFYRSKHASRSEAIVKNPWDQISLNSPRTELLPDRLFKLLGKISSHHGYSFEDVMRLPLKEMGVGNDEAHPRYIACLLRLGDLLDLDCNRFCPVMLKTAGTLPLDRKSVV